MFKFKIDVLRELKERGYTSYVIQRDKLIPQSACTKMRAGIVPGIISLDTICNLLQCDIGDIIEHVTDSDTSNNET